MQQSDQHPDGWGVAYYNAGAPHVIKSVSSAQVCQLFRRVSGIVASETVLAHLRKATQGSLSIINTHPFQFGHWVFVHNGNIRNFEQLREPLLARVPAVLRRYILGDTDSELLFYLLLGHMARRCELHRVGFPLEDIVSAIRETVDEVTSLAGPMSERDDAPADETFLTFALTNGTSLVAHQGGKNLYWTTWKRRCPERDDCPSYGAECEAPTQSGFVKHLVVSSEPLQGENIWNRFSPGEIVAVDWRMRLVRETVDSRARSNSGP